MVLVGLRGDSYRPWHGRDVAQILNVTNINSLCTRMSHWARGGRSTRSTERPTTPPPAPLAGRPGVHIADTPAQVIDIVQHVMDLDARVDRLLALAEG